MSGRDSEAPAPRRCSRLAAEGERAVDELASVADLIRWGASRFREHDLHFGHGTDDAFDEASWLVLESIHLDPGVPAEVFRARLTRAERADAVHLLVRRIEERRPAAYLVGRAWFAGLEFAVDERVLVPRSPLGELIERGFEPWLEGRRVERVLDIGTGSGCIAVACALAFPESRVDAVDVSPGALEVAAANVSAYGLEERVRLVESDLYAALDGERYDLVVSNPPYVPAARLAALPAEFHAEPALGLVAGADGLDHPARIVDGAPAHLADDGLLVLEVGESAPALAARFPRLAFEWVELEHGGEGVLAIDAGGLRAGAA